jgi:Xaa-Pro aminopeptidase
LSTTNTIATEIQILPELIERSKGVYHNVKTSSSSYKNLDAFRRASLNNKVKDLTYYTDELRWIKSKSEIKLMRESASIVSQVYFGNKIATGIPWYFKNSIPWL